MKTLLVYHYHFRPGGVRSVIECGLQEWCAQRDWRRIVLLTGEAPPSDWLGRLAQNLPRVTLEVQADERLGYLSELAVEPGLPAQITSILGQYLAAVRPDLVWAHNLSLGRNVHLGLALESHCSVREVPLLCHDHDWWPQHRWERWVEMAHWGVDSISQAAVACFPTGPLVHHATVHPADAAVLGPGVLWLPNPVPAVAATLGHQLLLDKPYWLAPTRILRRKNLLEALILLKLVRPEVSTLLVAGPCSPAELPYAERALAGAQQVGIDLQLGVAAATGLSVPELMAPAEMVLQTSVQEGFGLTALEAAHLQKPLILRRLPGITDWLEEHGGQFPHVYDQLRLPPAIVPSDEAVKWETAWQQERCPLLPTAWRDLARVTGRPDFSHFAGLSLTGQSAVVQDLSHFQEGLRTANPWLEQWAHCLHEPAVAPQFTESWPSRMEQILRSPPTQGDPLSYLTRLFQAHLETAGAWPMLW